MTSEPEKIPEMPKTSVMGICKGIGPEGDAKLEELQAQITRLKSENYIIEHQTDLTLKQADKINLNNISIHRLKSEILEILRNYFSTVYYPNFFHNHMCSHCYSIGYCYMGGDCETFKPLFTDDDDTYWAYPKWEKSNRILNDIMVYYYKMNREGNELKLSKATELFNECDALYDQIDKAYDNFIKTYEYTYRRLLEDNMWANKRIPYYSMLLESAETQEAKTMIKEVLIDAKEKALEAGRHALDYSHIYQSERKKMKKSLKIYYSNMKKLKQRLDALIGEAS